MKWSIIILIGFLLTATVGGFFLMRSEQVLLFGNEDIEKEKIIEQVSIDPNNTNEIGYEFINNSVHLWNTQDDYYFNKSSGIQFTNHYEEYWTRNVFCIGYYSGEEWIKIKCADELDNFNRQIETDNETYVNATLWKDISYGAYDLRFGIQYYLGLDDENLTITAYGKNIGIDIPFDLGFAWKVKNVYIPGLEEDYIDINGTSYPLNGTYDLLFKNMNKSYFKIHDITKFLRLDWNKDLDYAVKMYGDGDQSNFYSMLLINAGHFNPGQEKQTTFQWIDADTSVEGSVSATTNEMTGLWGPYWINTTHGAIVFPDDLEDLSYSKTTDAGNTWTTTEVVGGDVRNIAVWFDKETPSDDGNLLHIVWSDTDDNLRYVNLNLDNGTLGNIIVIDSFNFATTSTTNNVAITKTLSGNLIASAVGTDSAEAWKSDNKTTWINIDSPMEATLDWTLLYPANTGSDNDSAAILWDFSASAISLKMYDDSENTWTETAISSGFIHTNYLRNMDASVRHSDGNILLSAHTNDDDGSDNLTTWDLKVDSIASPTVTQKTNVLTNTAQSGQVGVVINQQNNDVYISYLSGLDFLRKIYVYYYKSDDGMDTWGARNSYSETQDDFREVSGGRTVGDNGGRIQFAFFNDDLTAIYVNLVNDVEISASGPPAGDCWSYNSATQVTYIPDSCTYYTEGIGFT